VAKDRTVRLAVALARTRRASSLTVDEIAEDATKLYRLAMKAREAVEKQKAPDKFEAGASEILSRYGGELVRQRDAAGCVMGAKFADGPRTGFRNVFFVS
jgi:pantothenate synthetase